ncbi:MAG: glycosyltransferase, partial [Chloroflexota bacterium]|nr:glycosyltransferase [Chloroflexota bacterium]
MSSRLRTVCIVASGLTEKNVPLQPWRYLSEVAYHLAKRGHRVQVVTDGAVDGAYHDRLGGIPVHRLDTVRSFRWHANSILETLLEGLAPEVLLWHTGLTSLLHQRITAPQRTRVVAVFTSPLYQPRDLLRLGLRRVIRGYQLSAVHVLGTFAPRGIVRRALQQNVLAG